MKNTLKTVAHLVYYFAYKCLTFAFTHESGYTLESQRKNAHGGLHAETRGFILCLRGEHLTQPTFMTENSRRKRMHAL